MSHPIWHEYLNLLSFFASVLGLYLVVNQNAAQDDERDVADRILFSMTFTYWIVHCVAVGAQKWVCPDWETCLLSLKWTGIISYLLTFSCAMSLPLHRISASQRQPE